MPVLHPNSVILLGLRPAPPRALFGEMLDFTATCSVPPPTPHRGARGDGYCPFDGNWCTIQQVYQVLRQSPGALYSAIRASCQLVHTQWSASTYRI